MHNYKQLYIHYLDALKNEISSYRNEENIWKQEGEILNSPGNLCLHICGNLNHFIGAIIGNTGYIRDRDLEFSGKGVSSNTLISQIDETEKMLDNIFNGLSLSDLNKIYPDDRFGINMSYGYVLSLLTSHLAYHTGQINYHRRILDK